MTELVPIPAATEPVPMGTKAPVPTVTEYWEIVPATKTRMARAYEDDLRRKIFEAHARGHGSFRKLAS